MEKQQIIDDLKAIVKPYVKDPVALDTLTEDTDFISDLKINSANLVDIVLDIEEAFDIEIDNEAMQRMLDIRTTLEIITTKLGEK